MTKQSNTGLSTGGAKAPSASVLAAMHMVWREQLGDLATVCAGSLADEEDQLVLALRDLLANAPHPRLIDGLEVPAVVQVEELLGSQAAASAVLAMFGPAAGYFLSRGAAGLHAASVILPGASEDITAIGESLAIALVGAIAQALHERQGELAAAPIQLN